MSNKITIEMYENTRTTIQVDPAILAEHGLPTNVDDLNDALAGDNSHTVQEHLFAIIDGIDLDTVASFELERAVDERAFQALESDEDDTALDSVDDVTENSIEFEAPQPTHTWECSSCGTTLERYQGQGDQTCDCGAEYNASGQRLRDDWRGNPSLYDDDIDDLTGYEIQHVEDDSW